MCRRSIERRTHDPCRTSTPAIESNYASCEIKKLVVDSPPRLKTLRNSLYGDPASAVKFLFSPRARLPLTARDLLQAARLVHRRFFR